MAQTHRRESRTPHRRPDAGVRLATLRHLATEITPPQQCKTIPFNNTKTRNKVCLGLGKYIFNSPQVKLGGCKVALSQPPGARTRRNSASTRGMCMYGNATSQKTPFTLALASGMVSPRARR